MGNVASAVMGQKLIAKLELRDRGGFCGTGNVTYGFQTECPAELTQYVSPADLRSEMDQINTILWRHVTPKRKRYMMIAVAVILLGFVIVIAASAGNGGDKSKLSGGQVFGLIVLVAGAVAGGGTDQYFKHKLRGAVDEIRAHLNSAVNPRFAAQRLVWSVDSFLEAQASHGNHGQAGSGGGGPVTTKVWFIGISHASGAAATAAAAHDGATSAMGALASMGMRATAASAPWSGDGGRNKAENDNVPLRETY